MNHKKISRILSAVLAGTVMLGGQNIKLPFFRISDEVFAADMQIEDFEISDITMLDSYSVNAFKKEMEYLLSFDTNRLLAGFRENAGLNTLGVKRYGGWENTNIAGHAVGHYMSAIAQAYQNPSLTDA